LGSARLERIEGAVARPRRGAGARPWRNLLPAVSLALAAAAAPAQPAARTPEETLAHTVERGDTLIGLHGRLMRPDADWRIVQRLNRIADPRRLRPGSELRIPLALLREQAVEAEVLQAHGSVWHERAGAARRPLAAAGLLQAGDLIGTEAQSSLVLRLADGSRLLLGEKARLVLDRHVRLGPGGPVHTRLKLDNGSVEAQVPVAPAAVRTAPRFELRTPLVNLGVRGTEFRARTEAEHSWAEVTQGRVTAAAQLLEAGFGTVATPAGVAPPRALLAAPQVAGLPARVERLPLQLALPPLAGAVRQRAQVFEDREGGALLLQGLFDGATAAWTDNLPDGRYRLHLRAADADGVEGHPAQHAFTLKARPEPPFLLRPRAGAKLTADEVEFAWSRNPEAARYRLQVSASADFSAPGVTRDDITGTEVRVPLGLGTFHWRVASVRADGDVGPWGDPGVLERVQQPPPPPPPPPSAPDARTRQTADKGIVVAWPAAPVPGVSYQLQVARDEAFTQIVLDERTARSEYLLPELPPGTYRVRVRTLAADGRASGYGTPQVIEVPRSLWWLWLLPLLLLAF
jgi:hypothetical protein